MKILSICHVIRDGIDAKPGDILDLDNDIAAQWLADGWGLRAEEEPAKVETAAFQGAPETAVGRRQRRQSS